MDTRFRLLAAACALVLFAGVVSAFAVDGDNDVASDGDVAAFSPGEDDESVATGESSTTVADDGDESGDESQAAPDSEPDPDEASPDPTTAATTSTTRPMATTTTAPASPTTAPVGVTPTTPGTYTYDISGTVDGSPVSGTSELTVPAADADGRQAQVQAGPEGSSTTIYRFTPEGTYLEAMSMGTPGGALEFRADPPILVIPAGSGPGHEARGRLKGSGMASSITVDVVFTLSGVTADQATADIDATISGSAFGCNVDGDMFMTITARRADQLPLETRSQTDVTIGGLACVAAGSMRADTTTTLRR